MFVPLSNFHLISFKLILSLLFFGCCFGVAMDALVDCLLFFFLFYFLFFSLFTFGVYFFAFFFSFPLIIHFVKLHHFQFSSAHIIAVSFSFIVHQFLTDIFYHLLLLIYDLFVNGVFSLVLFCFH